MLAGILASAVLLGMFARGGAGWLIGFVVLVPWLRTLDTNRTLARTFLSAYLMSVAFTGAAGAWFGIAVGSYTQMNAATGLSVLLILAPLFQPQILVFALIRHVTKSRCGPVLSALAGAAAWVATERLIPKLLGDTLGQWLYPSSLLRQAADVGGTAGLTFLLLLANEGISTAIARRTRGVCAVLKPMAFAALVPLLLAGYGLAILSATPATGGKPLRIGLVQSNIVHYERLRKERGAYAAVREILDTHYAMSYDAVERQHVDAVLWSETAYPTTFGHPKSAEGAEFDQEILSVVQSAGVPFIFGTYDRDEAGEYNAAAFVTPGSGLLGFYRKTRPFLFTEYVPAWLNRPMLKRWLPWTGNWLPGTGMRVFPLRLTDGREIPVMPMICLDDVDTDLAIDGARMGAQVILTLSNDSWFTDQRLGAQMHQAAAAFRSIETRLPQFRVTTNGYSAVIDTTGAVIASAPLGARTLLVGVVLAQTPPQTLMVRWGNWVGLAGVAFLVLLGAVASLPSWRTQSAEGVFAAVVAPVFPVRVALLSPIARVVAGLLRAFSRTSLLWMGAAMLLEDSLRSHALAQIRTFTGFFLIPEAAAWCLLFAFSARASIENGVLMLTRGTWRLELAIRDIAAVEPWHLPIPGPGAWLRLTSGERWRYGIALINPASLTKILAAAGGTMVQKSAPSTILVYSYARLDGRRGRLDQPLAKFVLLPLVLAIVAFRLHQHIAYGSTFGEFYAFGLKAYLLAFALWWAGWIIGIVLSAAALRAVIEVGTLLIALFLPGRAASARCWLERFGLTALYFGLPLWILLHL